MSSVEKESDAGPVVRSFVPVLKARTPALPRSQTPPWSAAANVPPEVPPPLPWRRRVNDRGPVFETAVSKMRKNRFPE
jgi:hypothetical protein